VRIDNRSVRRAEGWRRIAVVVDESQASIVALQSAVAASRHHHARLTIISIAPRPWMTVAMTGMCPRRLEAEATAQAAMTVRRPAATLPADVPCTTVVRCGRVVKETLDVLRRHDCDLVFFAHRLGCALVRNRKAVRVMRKSGVDFVLMSSSSPMPTRASMVPLRVGWDGDPGLRSWSLADISVN
jgi:hypothetical protein